MTESIADDLRALRERSFASAQERYSAWKQLVEDPRTKSTSNEERFRLYSGAASALGASPALHEPGGIDQLIAWTRAAVDAAPRDKSLHGQAAVELSKVLARRAAMTREPRDWQACREHAEAMLGIVPQQDWRYPLYALANAAVYYLYAVATNHVDDATEAIARLEAVRSRVRRGSGIFGTTSAWLADMCFRTHCQTNDIRSLEEAIVYGNDYGETEHPLRSEKVLALTSLSAAYKQRYYFNLTDHDIACAAAFGDAAVDAARSPDELERVHAVRGSVYRTLFDRTQDPGALDKALDSYRCAIEHAEKHDDGDRGGMAVRLNNYANALAARYELHKQGVDLYAALETSRRALGMLPADDDPWNNRVILLKSLGLHLLQIARDMNDAQALLDAEKTLRDALAHAGHDADQRGRVHAILGEVYLETAARRSAAEKLDLVERALAAFDTACETLDQPFLLPAGYDLARRGMIASVAERQVGTLLYLSEIGKPDDRARWLTRALAAGESAKASVLAREVLRTRSAPPPEVPSSEAEEEQLLLANLARFESQELRHHGTQPELRDPLHLARMQRRAECYAELERVWSNMEGVSAAAADYVAVRKGRHRDWLRAPSLQASGCACIAVIPFRDPRPATASNQAADLRAGRVTYQHRLAVMATRGAMAEPAIALSAGEDPVPAAVDAFTKQVLVEAPWARRTETWHDAFVPLIAKLAATLGPVDELMISPSPHGFSLPWHLVIARAGWKTPRGEPVPVTTAPTLELVGSARTGAAGLTRWHVATDSREFGLDDPEGVTEAVQVATRIPVSPADGPPLVIGDPLGDLRSARGEAEAVARLLGVKALVGRDAHSATVRSALSGARVIHLATHARLDANEPLNSFICLADKNVPVREFVGLRSSAELIVLSACESGLGGQTRSEELFGLAYVLLRCGTREVIASLWRVDDEATEVLMKHFYEHLRAANSAVALAAAMSAVRDNPAWTDPYYWAGMILLATDHASPR